MPVGQLINHPVLVGINENAGIFGGRITKKPRRFNIKFRKNLEAPDSAG
jgi:hypothetical protein